MTILTVNPVTRGNGLYAITVEVADGRVVRAESSGLQFRGFEILIREREPADAPYFMERICGICSTAHGMAAAMALEDAYSVKLNRNAYLVRNLIFGADFLQNHIRHFYFLVVPDYVRLGDGPPFAPRYQRDYRLPPAVEQRIAENYRQAFLISRACHEMVALFAGKAPHVHGIVVGGATVQPSLSKLLEYRQLLVTVADFVERSMVPDTDTIAAAYQDYSAIGTRPRSYISYGSFPLGGGERMTPAGVLIDGRAEALDLAAISEDVSHAWYDPNDGPASPRVGGTHPQYGKSGAYSWVKAPRYNGKPLETGPLARLTLAGLYDRGPSTMDRIVARTRETALICQWLNQWLDEVDPDEPIYTPHRAPLSGRGVGIIDSMRGALGHWINIANGQFAQYQVVTPSAWNFSPRDAAGEPGPAEACLVGTPVADPSQPIEIGRVLRSFDLCAACATQVISAGRRYEPFVV